MRYSAEFFNCQLLKSYFDCVCKTKLA